MHSKQRTNHSNTPKKGSIVKKSYEQNNMTYIHNLDLEYAYSELKTNAFKLLVYFYSKGDGWVFNKEVIARLLDIEIRTVQDRIKELESKGYLLQQRGKKGEISVYLVGKKLVGEYT